MTRDFGPPQIGARLERVASRLPSKVALSEGDGALTYAELDAAAHAVAGCLTGAAAERPGMVCTLFESKLAAAKAFFGAARCGRAYVPLDARDPDERLRFIVGDSRPIALLTEKNVFDRARALAPPGCEVVDVEALVPRVGANIPYDVSPDTLAYLYYTSGSTGQPKGVGQTHRNLLFFADAYATALEIEESDRLTLLYSLSFSGANMDIYAGLLNGATLFAYDVRRDGIAALADWLERERITVLHSVPTVYRELFGALSPERSFAHLRAIDLGGEAVPSGDAALFRQHTLPKCILVNHLAATEASVIAQYVVRHEDCDQASGILPVGPPPQGVRVSIRQADGGQAPPGEVGEIVVSSAHVSPGYWQRPELNALAFAADPTTPGWRSYFTGDLGRVDGQGNLHFLGRRTNRVKIRGYSIDLAEVEAAVLACPGVLNAAVLPTQREGAAEHDRLLAYVATASGANARPLVFRRFLAARLPAYMVPAGFVFVDELPVTASGKIDRRALAAFAQAHPVERTREPPRDDVERTVAAIFERLLKQHSIGRDDDFFLLGGDSLSVMELQTRLRDAFALGLTSIHEDPTVAAIAAQIRDARATGSAPTRAIPVLVPLRERGSAPPLFLVHGRLGQALVSPHFLHLLGDDQPVWAFQAHGLDGLDAPHSTIEAMAAHYVAEMRKRRPRGPYFIGALCAGALVAIAMARMLSDAGELVLPLLLLDPPERPFAMADAAMTEERVLGRLKKKRLRGTSVAPLDDPVYARASVRVAQAFELAIRQHRPVPYEGPVYMFRSSARIAESPPAAMTKLFAGKVERFEVAATHREILDAHNVLFASSLGRCLDAIRGAAEVAGPDGRSRLGADFAPPLHS